jgi:hypothetical protein
LFVRRPVTFAFRDAFEGLSRADHFMVELGEDVIAKWHVIFLVDVILVLILAQKFTRAKRWLADSEAEKKRRPARDVKERGWRCAGLK